MNLFLALCFAVVIIAISAIDFIFGKKRKWIPPVCGIAIIIFTIIMAVLYHSWWIVLWSFLLAGAVYMFFVFKKLFWEIFFGVLLLVIIIGGGFLVSHQTSLEYIPVSLPQVPSPKPQSPAPAAPADKITVDQESCQPAQNLGLTTDGMVVNNLDDGDYSMGTIVWITRDTPTKEPVLFVLSAGASVDIEYKGDMYFTTDRFSGTLAEGTCLAEKLYKNADIKIAIPYGEEIPSGWEPRYKVDGWWTASQWLYMQANIEPKGLTASKGIFISTTQENRDIITKKGEVVYGQFWQPPHDEIVTHIQVRPNQKQTIPLGYEGTYWIWTGDFNVGETDLQKRMLQATFMEVVYRDSIKSVTLLSCGTLPPELDKSVYTLYTGESKFGDVTWVTGREGWTCKATN